jgi:predicted transcriptional regulator YdeE
VYTDYESDANGPYNAIIGCKVKNLNSIPEGFIGKQIPAASYHVYSSSGELNVTVPETWQLIWSTEHERAVHSRF